MKYSFYSFLANKVFFYKILCIVLGVVSFILAGILVFLMPRHILDSDDVDDKFYVQKIPSPLYDKVIKIIEPLKYSGLPALLREDVSLDIDFVNQEWKLRNIHRFDQQGNILLDENRYGLCGELAAFIYPHIKHLFGDRYIIEFALVAESGFFLYPQASHIGLIIQEKEKGNIFFLDPSFRRYGSIDEFDNYLFFDQKSFLPFIQEQDPDVVFSVNQGTPALIHKNRMVFLTVDKVDDIFDKDNFTIALTATKKYAYSGRYIYAVRKRQGVTEFLENKGLAEALFVMSEYQRIRERIFFWANKF